MDQNSENQEPLEKILLNSVELYMEHGRYGKNIFSEQAEKELEAESEALAAYVISLGMNLKTLLEATFDPIKAEEARQRALRFHNRILQLLPKSTI